MKRKHLIPLLTAMALMFSMLGSAYAVVGGQDDPLISKSFVDNTYPSQVLQSPLAELNDSLTVLRFKLSQMAGSSAVAVKPLSITARSGDTLTAGAGASFTVFSGSLRLDSLSGALIDVTTGSLISRGQSLSAGHRYVCAENTSASIYAASDAAVGALGSVEKFSAVQIVFSDVSANHWFYNDVYYAVDKGLIDGVTNTIYDPDGNLTYAAAIKLAACMHQLYNSGSITLKNSADGIWYDSYVGYALENGIISGQYANYDAMITRSDFVSIFYNSMPTTQYAQINSVSDGSIPGVPSSAPHASEIYTFYRAGILIGSDDTGAFNPDSTIKRSEVAAVITRMYESGSRKTITL